MRAFSVVWFGQFVTLLGSSASAFALSLWIYQTTGSLTYFAIGLLVAILPGVVVSPFAGVIVDRCGKRAIMLVGTATSGFAMSCLGAVYLAGSLAPWHVYLFDALQSVVTAFLLPTLSVVVPLFVPPGSIGRANGLVQLAFAASQLGGPLLASVLVGSFGVGTVIGADLLSFAVAVVTLVAVRFPAEQLGAVQTLAVRADLLTGWRFIVRRPGLFGLVGFLAVVNFLNGAVRVLITPLVLTSSTMTALGVIAAVGGMGMVCGSLVISAWPPRRKLVFWICGAGVAGGCVVVGGGLTATVGWLTIGAFLFYFCLPVIHAPCQTLWQAKSPAELRGRVVSACLMISQGAMPLSYAIVGPVAEMAREHGRISAVMVGCGVFLIIAAGAGLVSPHVRRVETALPDYLAIDSRKEVVVR